MCTGSSVKLFAHTSQLRAVFPTFLTHINVSFQLPVLGGGTCGGPVGADGTGQRPCGQADHFSAARLLSTPGQGSAGAGTHIQMQYGSSVCCHLHWLCWLLVSTPFLPGSWNAALLSSAPTLRLRGHSTNKPRSTSHLLLQVEGVERRWGGGG